MNRRTIPFLLLTALVLLLIRPLPAQISYGGRPFSFSIDYQDVEVNTIVLAPPGRAALKLPPDKSEPPLIGVTVKAAIDMAEQATTTAGENGALIERIGVLIPGAHGIGLYYSAFYIPDGGALYIYTEDRSRIIGSFTSSNNPENGLFATEIIPGEKVILEYNHPGKSAERPVIRISEALYVFQEAALQKIQYGFGDSGPCEVNINCPEGDVWKDEKRGVARIVLKEGSGAYLCTGSLINNVRQDSTPYFLTANHCGPNATASDYSQWMFYFNYEAPGCSNPLVNPQSQTITGSTLVSKGFDNPSIGSDFKLLLLDEGIPMSYNPYFNGWNNSNTVSPSGVGIHHPKGDIKKISTYFDPLVSSDYNGSGQDPGAMFWRVTWDETQSGHGVTEGGSSGSPIFDDQHHIRGTLTGGAASCQNPTAPDYYGKFSYHWESNGNTPLFQLRPWLDPDNTGTAMLDGFGYGNILSASFSAKPVTLSPGEMVTFLDQSSGSPTEWDWYFEKGQPERSGDRDSVKVGYFEVGKFDARLIVGDGFLSDTLLKHDFIVVKARFYPNPANDHLFMDFGNRIVDKVEVEIFDSMGNRVKEMREEQSSNLYRIQLPDLRKGMYFFGYTIDGVSFDPQKIIVL